jgi:HEAT repeat protein
MAQVRMAAAHILARIEDQTAIDLLAELLADDNSYVKTSATNALVKIGKPVVPRLMEVLNNKAENISLPATDFVGDKIGDRYKKELAKRAALQVSAASILGSINDPRAIAPLLEAMEREAGDEATEEEKSNAASVRSGAANALGAMGPAAAEPLIRILEGSESETARMNAASILGTIGDKRAVVPLINALKDEEKSVRANAATSLGTLKDRRATLPLIEALKDVDVVTRANAAKSLGTIADKESITPSLIDVVMDKTEREQIRTEAINSLGIKNNEAAQETLVKVLIDEYEKDGTRKSAAAALRTTENTWASEALIALLRGEIVYGIFMPEKGVISKWLKEEGDDNLIEDITALVEVSTGGEKIEIKAPKSGALIKIYTQEGEGAEADALIGLISFMDKEIKQEERSSIRSAAALALGKVKGDGALSALMRSVRKDKSAAVRKNAAQALWEQDKAEGRPVLIKALRHDDSGVVRSESAKGLGKGNLKGADGVPPLMRAMRKDKYESTRVQAAWALSEIKDKRSVVPLKDVIVEGRKGEAEADAVIAKVITALDNIAGPAVDPLVEVLQNKDIEEIPRSKAARILGLIENVKATEPLIAALKDESVVIRSEAAKSLGLITDRRAVEPLIEMLADEDEWVTARANAAEALGKIKDERAVRPLIDALASEIAVIRGNAVVALGPIKDKRATMPLVRILEDEREDDTIRTDAVLSLKDIADARAEVVDALMVALGSDLATIRQNAAAALGELAVKDAVEPLMGIVSDMNESVALRANAAEALGAIEDERAASLLRERLGDYDESDTVWNEVAEAAGKLRVAQMPTRVSERAYDTWEANAVRFAAFMALARIAGEEGLTVLLEMLDDDTKEVRAAAALALGETGSKEAVQPLMDKLENDAEEIVRRDSAKGLAALADPASEQALIKAHKEDSTASVKNEAAIALGNIKGKDGIAALMDTLQDTSKGKKLRWNSAKALGTAGSSEAVPALESALKSDIGGIHFEAAEALRTITGESFGYER